MKNPRYFKFGKYSRCANDGRTLCKEEKFDTWLDLEKCLCFKQKVTQCDKFHDYEIVDTHWSPTLETLSLLDASLIPPQRLSASILTPCLPAYILKQILISPPNFLYKDIRLLTNKIKRIKNITQHIIREQINHLGKNISKSLIELLTPGISKWTEIIQKWPKEILWAYYHYEQWTKVIAKHRSMYAYIGTNNIRRRSYIRTKDNSNILQVIDKNTIICLAHDIAIITHKGKDYMLTEDLLLEVYNKVSELFCVLLFNHYQSGTNLPSNQYDLTLRYVKILVEVISSSMNKSHLKVNFRKDNKGFSFSKLMEGIGISEIIRRSDQTKGWDNIDLQKQLWDSACQEGIIKKVPYEDSEIGKLWKEATIPQIAEIMGICKIAGHPAIDQTQGLQDLYDRTHKHLNVDPDAMRDSIGLLIRDLFRNYYRVHRKYPNNDLQEVPNNSPLHRIIGQNIDPVSARGVVLWKQIPRTTWYKVKILKTEEFDPIDNQLSLLKDKALGLTRSKVFQTIIYPKKEGKVTLGDITERRALLKYLLRPDLSTEFTNYMDRFENDHPWTDAILEYLVIKLTPKELELKAGGRMFGASPQRERNRRLVSDSNCMCFMDKYYPPQLLTPNELETLKKIFSFRYMKNMFSDSLVLQISADFSAWNNYFRSESVNEPARKTVGAFLGKEDLYGKTMNGFEKTLYYYYVHGYLKWWDGQLGGIDGLAQPVWSYTFGGRIASALERLGYIYQFSIKGDDIRILIVVPNDSLRKDIEWQEAVQTKKEEIMDALRRICAETGCELKKEESFVSISVIATSKQYQVNDTWLPAASKKVMKAMSLSNVLFPTFEDIISSVYSNCHSACSQTTAILPSFITATSIATSILIDELSDYIKRDEDAAVILMWPQVLSGPGGFPLQTFFVRGENDMLSVAISLMRSLTISQDPIISSKARAILTSFQFDVEDDSLLIGDPYAIPVKAPVRPSSLLKALIKQAITKWVKNPEMRRLFGLNGKYDASLYKKVLSSMRPYYAKLVTMIWECTPFYIVDEVVSKFMQSSTVVAFLSCGKAGVTSSRLAHKALSAVVNASKKRVQYWLRTINHSYIGSDLIMTIDPNIWYNQALCSTEMTHIVRRNAWGKEIQGLTYPSLVDQNIIFHPRDLPGADSADFLKEAISHITVNQDMFEFQVDLETHHFASIPGNTPWLGSSTSTKIKYLDGPLIYKSSILSKISRLITLRRLGAYYGEDYCKVLDCTISSITKIDVKELILLSPEVPFGHIAHRGAMNSFSLTTMPNYRPNFAQLVNINNETLTILKKDTANRTINYAARNYYLIAIALFPLQSEQMLPKAWPTGIKTFIHEDARSPDHYQLCPYCANIVEDTDITMDTNYLPELRHYQDMSCVGASAFDEKALREQIEKSIIGKTRRILEGQYYDPNNIINIAKATRLVLKKITNDTGRLFSEAQCAQFSRVPQGSLLDIMSITLGFKSLSTHNISLNVIRAIPPDILYVSLVETVFCWVYRVGNDVLSNDNIWSLTLIQKHLDPLSPLFEFLSLAGVYNKIAYGFNLIKICQGELIWPHGAANDGTISSRYFISKHFHLFMSWLKGVAQPTKVKMFTAMQDDNNIRQSLIEDTMRLYKTIARYVNTFKTIKPASNLFIKYVRKLIKRFSTQCQNVEMDDFSTKLSIIYNWILTRINGEISSNLLFLTIYGSVMCYLIILPLITTLGRWSHYADLSEFVAGTTFSLIEQNVEWDYSYPPLTEVTITNSDYYSWLFSNCTSEEIKLVWHLAQELFTDPSLGETITNLIIEFDSSWIDKYKWANTYFLQVMTDEDAERVLRSSGRNLESYLDEVDYVEKFEDKQIKSHMNFYDECPMSYDHPQIDDPIEMTEMEEYNMLQNWVSINKQALFQSWDSITRVWHYQSEPSQILRCIGGNNASGVKWWYILNKYNILEHIDNTSESGLSLCVGDGGGSVSYCVVKNTKNISSLICTLAYRKSGFASQSDYNSSNPPYEVMSEVKDLRLTKRIDHTSLYPGDISNLETHHLINLQSQMYFGGLVLVTCDIDWDHKIPYTQYINYLINTLHCALKYGNTTTVVVIKLKISDHVDIYYFLSLLYSNYMHVHIISNPCSHIRDYEVFCVLSNPISNSLLSSNLHDFIHRNICFSMNDYHKTKVFQLSKVISENLLKYYCTGESTSSCLIPILRGVRDLNLPLCRLQRILDGIMNSYPLSDDHYCKFWDNISIIVGNVITLSSFTHINTYGNETSTREGKGKDMRVTAIVGAHQVPIAKGVGGLASLLAKIIYYVFIREFIKSIISGNTNWIYIMDKSLSNAIPLLWDYIRVHDKYLKWVYNNNVHILLVGPHNIIINQLICDSLNFTLRLLGWKLMGNYQIQSREWESMTINELGGQSFFKGECCRESSKVENQRWKKFEFSAMIPHIAINSNFQIVPINYHHHLLYKPDFCYFDLPTFDVPQWNHDMHVEYLVGHVLSSPINSRNHVGWDDITHKLAASKSLSSTQDWADDDADLESWM